MLIHRQRRAWYRVPVAPVLEVRLILRDADGTEFPGRVGDVSLGGLGTFVVEGAAAPGGCCECRVELPDGETLDCVVEIRNVRVVAGSGLRIGGRFAEMPRAALHRLERFIREVEREILRRTRG